MTQRIIGPTGTRRRRWTLVAPFFIVALVALVLTAGAQAVHEVGVFELETATSTLVVGSNTYYGANATDQAAAGDDWDNVCYSVVHDANCGTTTADHALASAWASDKFASTTNAFTVDSNATIFTGGGSKDPEDLTKWAWKDGAGGLPDKDNLQHAFAARYNTSNGAGSNCPLSETSCEVIYYGSDRFDNSGDAQQGFWFIQSPMATAYDDDHNSATAPVPCPQKLSGGTGFCDPSTGDPVSHQNKDLLVISDFSNGGTTSTITIYKWNNGALDLVAGGPNQSAECGLSQDDPFCGIVNLTDGTPAEWPFLDKSGNDSYLAGELFEAGVDLTNLGLGGTCFSTVVSETRSSTSTTSTLKDFVVAPFGQCTSSVSTAQNWLPNDTATLNVVAPSSTYTGEVRFTLYKGTPGTDCGVTSGATKVYPTTGAAYEAVSVSQTNGSPATVTASTTNGSGSVTYGTFKVTNTDPTTGTGSNYFWKVHFQPDASFLSAGVPTADNCQEATTGLTITN